MNDLENRLTAALTERADGLTHSPNAWEQNRERLGRNDVRPPSRFRAPLLIAAAVLAITATVAVVGVTNRPEKATPPVAVATGCGFIQQPAGSTGSTSSTSDTGALLTIKNSDTGRSCFFDGIAWHAAPSLGAASPIRSLGVGSAAGRSWVFAVLSGEVDKLSFLDGMGAPLAADFRINTSSDDGIKTTSIVARVYGAGTVEAIGTNGKVLQRIPFDVSTVPESIGPVITATTIATKANLQAIGTAIVCPAGSPDAVATIPIAGGTPVELALKGRGAAGEPVVCAVSGATPLGLVPTAEPGGSVALSPISSTLPRLWGTVGPSVSRVEITLEDKVTVFVAGKPTGRQVALTALGSDRAFAMAVPVSPATFQISTFDARGNQLFSIGYSHA